MAEPRGDFADVLRELRTRARLSQQQLGDRAAVSLRTVSDLERGVAATPQRETVRRLGDALGLIGSERFRFETAARGRPPAGGSDNIVAAASAMRSLPRDVASFTGRQQELEHLADGAMTAGGVVAIHAIGGMAGVGKTAFAVHAAHQLADQFPGGQLFLQLHGHTPGQSPVDPADALASLLLAIGVPPAQVPASLDARAALWRDRVAGRPLLLLLDDAAASEQVRPLLPGAGGSLVLVTSRRHLSALDDATAITLDSLPPAAALDGMGLAAARRTLEVLYDHCLLAEPAPGRYRLHDLLREHARALAGRVDPEEDSDAATARLLDYYQHTAAAANDLIAGWARPGSAPDADWGPAAVPALADQAQALAWAQTERASLLACVDYAAGTGQHARVVALTAGISGLMRRDGPWAEAVVRCWAAVHAAEHLGDQLSQANALSDLSFAWQRTGDYPAAAKSLERALDVYRELGEQSAQAKALCGLGAIWYLTDDYPAAVRALEEALSIYRDLGDRLGTAMGLGQLGAVRRTTGDYPVALKITEQALSICRDLGDRLGTANALNDLGAVRRLTGGYMDAIQAHEQALGIYLDLENRFGQANALHNLGIVRALTNDRPGAVEAQEQALGLYRDLDNSFGQANALANLGDALRLTGDYPAAARALDEALGIYGDIGDRGSAAMALNKRGTLHRVSGDLALARGCHQQSLELSRAIDSTWDEAHALAGLGRCALADGDAPQAEALLRQALEIFQRTGAAEVPDLLAELDALASLPPTE